jgi:hypothetical protein
VCGHARRDAEERGIAVHYAVGEALADVRGAMRMELALWLLGLDDPLRARVEATA